jgi:uncharacterized coiled-coil protein SlyX
VARKKKTSAPEAKASVEQPHAAQPHDSGPESAITGTTAAPIRDAGLLQTVEQIPVAVATGAPVKAGEFNQVIDRQFIDPRPLPPIFFNVNPAIASLSPPGAVVGSRDFTLTVLGSNFGTSSTVTWNQSPRATTFLSNTQLTAAIGAADLVSPGSATVVVSNQGAAGTAPLVSNGVTFTITPDIAVLINQLRAITAIPPQLLSELQTFVTLQQSQIDTLNTQVNNDQTTISGLNAQVGTQQATISSQQTQITALTAQVNAAKSQSASPMDVAQSFKSVVDQIQQSAQAAGGLQHTVTNMSIQLKSLVSVMPATATTAAMATLVFPDPTALPDPSHLSTMNFSFGAIPSLAAAGGLAAPPPVPSPTPAPPHTLVSGPPLADPPTVEAAVERPESEIVTTVTETLEPPPVHSSGSEASTTAPVSVLPEGPTPQ